MPNNQVTVEKVALKPCPFCGDCDEFNPSVSTSFGYAEPGDPEKGTVGNPEAGLVEKGCFVECDKCGACGANEDTEAEAITAWNTRIEAKPPEAGQVKRVASEIAEQCAQIAEKPFDWGPGEAPRTYLALAKRLAANIRIEGPSRVCAAIESMQPSGWEAERERLREALWAYQSIFTPAKDGGVPGLHPGWGAMLDAALLKGAAALGQALALPPPPTEEQA